MTEILDDIAEYKVNWTQVDDTDLEDTISVSIDITEINTIRLLEELADIDRRDAYLYDPTETY